jgi:hypothetical protein
MSSIRVNSVRAHSGNTVNLLSHLSAPSLDVVNKAVLKADVDILNGQLKVADLSGSGGHLDSMTATALQGTNGTLTNLTAGSGTLTNLTTTAATITSLTTTAATIASLNTTNLIVPSLSAEHSSETLKTKTIAPYIIESDTQTLQAEDFKFVVSGSLDVTSDFSNTTYTANSATGNDWNGYDIDWDNFLDNVDDEIFELVDTVGVKYQWRTKVQVTATGDDGGTAYCYVQKVNPELHDNNAHWIVATISTSGWTEGTGQFLLFSTENVARPDLVQNWQSWRDGYFTNNTFKFNMDPGSTSSLIFEDGVLTVPKRIDTEAINLSERQHTEEDSWDQNGTYLSLRGLTHYSEADRSTGQVGIRLIQMNDGGNVLSDAGNEIVLGYAQNEDDYGLHMREVGSLLALGATTIRLTPTTADSFIEKGNFGFGTKTPGEKVDVIGTVKASTGFKTLSGGNEVTGDTQEVTVDGTTLQFVNGVFVGTA